MTLKEYNERMIIGEPIYLNDNTANRMDSKQGIRTSKCYT